MNTRHILASFLGIALAAGMGGCGEPESIGNDSPTKEVRQHEVRVTPEFVIEGTEGLPDNLYLTELGLSITEIRLEPVTTQPGGIAYSTNRPIRLTFDVASGETTRRGEPATLPEAGRFLVSMRLEARQHYDEELERMTTEPSLSIAGFVAGGSVTRSDPRHTPDNNQDGNPLPLPFDEKNEDSASDLGDRPAHPSEWTPFHYGSKRAVFYTFTDVEFVPGEQILGFTFDVRDWAVELVDPISHAVSTNNGPTLGDEQGIDVTNQLDSAGRGAEMLMRSTSVRNEPMRPGLL